MDNKLWRNLPTELIQRIIEESEPSIDVQLFFKIIPKKINEARAWRLWYLLKSHDGIVYNLESKTLHNFRVPGYHIIRRPIQLDWMDAGLASFNQHGEEYNIEVNSPDGCFFSVPGDDSWVTELRVLLKGSGLCRMLNVSDSSF